METRPPTSSWQVAKNPLNAERCDDPLCVVFKVHCCVFSLCLQNLDSRMQQLLTDLEAGLRSVLRRLHSTHHIGGGGLDSSRSFEGGIIDDGWVSGEVVQRACDTGTAKECSASMLKALQWL